VGSRLSHFARLVGACSHSRSPVTAGAVTDLLIRTLTSLAGTPQSDPQYLPARAKLRDWLVGIVESMTNAEPSQGALWRYQFSRPDETVVETGEFKGDDTAEARAREISTSTASPIVIKRHSAHVDAWVYVTEVDERP
jgi:hypothetical protein